MDHPFWEILGDEQIVVLIQVQAENGTDGAGYSRRRRHEREQSVPANRPDDPDDAVEGAKETNEKAGETDSGAAVNGDAKPQKKSRIKTVINKVCVPQAQAEVMDYLRAAVGRKTIEMGRH